MIRGVRTGALFFPAADCRISEYKAFTCREIDKFERHGSPIAGGEQTFMICAIEECPHIPGWGQTLSIVLKGIQVSVSFVVLNSAGSPAEDEFGCEF